MFAIKDYRAQVESFHAQLGNIDTAWADRKIGPEAWSFKEIVGHLIDSAANNHLRFVRLQEKDLEATYPGYDAEPWIAIQSYNSAEWKNLVELWYRYNLHILHVISLIAPASLERVWRRENQNLTLEFLVEDYYRHLTFHVEHFEKRYKEVAAVIPTV